MSSSPYLGFDDEPLSVPDETDVSLGPDGLARFLLSDLLSAVISTPDKYVEALIQRWGLGCEKVTLDAAGEIAGVTRERMRQVEKLVANKAETTYTPLAGFLRDGLRNPEELRRQWPNWTLDAWERLFTLHGMKLQSGFRESLETFQEKIRTDAELKRLLRESINDLGFVNLHTLQEALGPLGDVDSSDWDSLLSSAFPRATAAFPWAWVAKGTKPNQSEGFLIRQLSVTLPLDVHTAWEGVVIGARSRSHRHMLPPKTDFLKLLRASSSFSVGGEEISGTSFDTSPPEGVVAWAVNFIQSQPGGVTELTQFLTAGAAQNYKPSTLQQYARMRPEFRCQANLVWLAGAEPDESAKEALSLVVEAAEKESSIEFVSAGPGGFSLRARVGGFFLRTGCWPVPHSVLDLLGDGRRHVACCDDFESEAVAAIRMGSWQGFSSLRNHLFLEHSDALGESLDSTFLLHVTPENVQVDLSGT